jgi:FkbM family methyltransferase
MKVFWQIFNFEEYSTLRGMVNVFLILDLGANVGYSSAYFLSCFPDARSIAVEPDEQNVAICRMNLEPYDGRALVLTGAVWSQAGLLSLSKVTSGDGLECARMVAQPQEGSLGNVRAWNVGDLIDISGCTAVDLLKVDIEGAELEVFGASARAWLHRVRNICIELHGPDCERTFFKAVAGFNYELERSGELTICRNLHPKLAADTN